MVLRFLSASSSYISDAKIVISRFELNDDEANLDVWIKDKYFEVPLMLYSKLIKENKHWKWYGNQVSK